MALVVLSTNNWSVIKAHIAQIMAAINAVTQGSYIEVAIPSAFSRAQALQVAEEERIASGIDPL
jgi:hypothetical protein